MRTAMITAAVAAGVLVAPGAIALDHTSSAGQRGPAASARTVGESVELTRFTAWASGTGFAATPNSLVAAGVRTPIVAFIGGGGSSGGGNGIHNSGSGARPTEHFADGSAKESGEEMQQQPTGEKRAG